MRGILFIALLGCNPQGSDVPDNIWETLDASRSSQWDTAVPEDTGLILIPTMDDMCPTDPNKTEPGFCGCDWIDLDIDGANGPDSCVHREAVIDSNATAVTKRGM